MLLTNGNILAHRGYWLTPEEKNTPQAFMRAFEQGFGIETDLRDQAGKLVIAHDLPTADALLFDDFLTMYKQHASPQSVLALNIKADGLQALLAEALRKATIAPSAYFVFDMSVPDTMGYLKANLTTFSRISDVEPIPAFAQQAKGFWLDALEAEWLTEPWLQAYQQTYPSHPLSVVSPELHRRPHLAAWQAWRSRLAEWPKNTILFCTDYPTEASAFFNE
jgi:hypothetical protein